MAKFIGYLRGLGPLGSLVANILVFLTTNWVTTASVVTGLIAALWASAVSFFQEPSVEVGIGIFLATLWTMVGVLYLYDRTRPRAIRIAPDYRYGLTYEGIILGIDPLNDETLLSFPFQLRNFSSAPIQYTVEAFDLRIESRALPKPAKTLVGYLARGAGKTIAPSRFKKSEVKEFFGRRVQGTAEISIVYGHPEERPVRRLRIGLDITLHLPIEFQPLAGAVNQMAAFGADIVKEIDEPIDALASG